MFLEGFVRAKAVALIKSSARMCLCLGKKHHTDEQYQSLGRRITPHPIRLHAMTNWADEVDVKDRVDVDEMEEHRNAQEAKAAESHGRQWLRERSRH